MKEWMIQTFTDYRTIIVFLHVLSAVIWVGGMIAIRFATHPSLMMIEDQKIRLERAAQTLKKLFMIVSPFVIVLIVTAIIMAVGLGFRAAAVDAEGNIIDAYAMQIYNLIHVKEAIWMIMAVNLVAMMYRRNKAETALLNSDIATAKSHLGLIAKYMVPLNIILGVSAIFLGVFLRNAY